MRLTRFNPLRRRQRWRFLSALGLMLSLFMTWTSPIVLAQSPFYWDFINVNIDVQTNGDMLVTETQKYVFTQKHTNERFRYIPLKQVDAIDQISVREGNRSITPTIGTRNNQQWIRWQHELTAPDDTTFTLKYRVVGGLQVVGERIEVNWKALFPDRTAPIKRGQVTVRLPEQLARKILFSHSYGQGIATTQTIDQRTIGFTLKQALQPQQELGVKVAFPRHILNIAIPKWQQEQQTITSDQKSFWNTIALLVGGLSAPFGLMGLLWGWSRIVESGSGGSGGNYSNYGDSYGSDGYASDSGFDGGFDGSGGGGGG